MDDEHNTKLEASNYLRQLKYSSCPSSQSKIPLQTSDTGMHDPSWHVNCVLGSHAGGDGLPGLKSSSTYFLSSVAIFDQIQKIQNMPKNKKLN